MFHKIHSFAKYGILRKKVMQRLGHHELLRSKILRHEESNEMVKPAFIEYLSQQMGLYYISDLKFLNNHQKKQLVRALKQILPDDFYLSEWNDALDYLCGAMPETDREIFKRKLITLLKGKRFQR